MKLIERIRGNHTLINGSLFSIFSFFNQGISFLLLILLANYIQPAEYGKLSLFNTIVQFLGYFAALSTQGFLSVSYFQRGKDHFSQDFSSVSAICATCTVLFCMILVIAGNPLGKAANLSPKLLWIAVIISSIHIFFGMLLDYFRIQEKVKTYGLLSCSFAIINLILSLYLVIGRNLNWEGRIYAQTITTIAYGTLAIFLFARFKLFTTKINWPGTKMILLWGIPLIPHLASVWLKQGGDRFIINHFHTIADVGLFSFALNLTSIIIMVGSAFNATNSVSIFKTLSLAISPDSKIQQLSRQARNILSIYIAAAILIVIGASIGIPLMLPNYNAAIPYFLILSIQGFGQCVYFLYCNYLFYFHQNKKIMYVTFCTSILHVLLSFIFTRYSLYFTCCIYVLMQVIIVIFIKKYSMQAIINNITNTNIVKR